MWSHPASVSLGHFSHEGEDSRGDVERASYRAEPRRHERDDLRAKRAATCLGKDNRMKPPWRSLVSLQNKRKAGMLTQREVWNGWLSSKAANTTLEDDPCRAANHTCIWCCIFSVTQALT